MNPEAMNAGEKVGEWVPTRRGTKPKVETSTVIVDAFAGAGGWSEGLRSLGLSDIGIELDRDCCLTRVSAGHRTIRADVSVYPPEAFAGRCSGLILSPPCQAFSMAGKRAGMQDLARIHAAVEAARSGWRDELRAGPWADPRSALILEVLRWTWTLRPVWVACEQVPPALPIWEHMADVLRAWGYDARALKLLAADYGVPQTRLRAFLLAHRDGVRVAEPTHTKRPTAELFGERLPWVTMASALGWVPGEMALDRRVGGFAADASAIADDRPAPTLSLSHGREVFVRTGTNSMKHNRNVEDMVPYERSIDAPAPTLDGKVGSAWKLRMGNQERATERIATEPAPTTLYEHRANDVRWVHERPAMTVHGTFSPEIQAPPGDTHRNGKLAGGRLPDAVRITQQEAAVLQGFRPDYPFRGTKSSRFSQIGNAVPPDWAAQIIAAFLARERVVP